MSLVLDQLILEVDLPFYDVFINQWLISISLLHCFLGVFAWLYLEAHELKCVLLTS